MLNKRWRCLDCRREWAYSEPEPHRCPVCRTDRTERHEIDGFFDIDTKYDSSHHMSSEMKPLAAALR